MKKTKLFLTTAALSLMLYAVCTSGCKKIETEPKDWFGSDLVFDTLDRLGTVAAFNLNDMYNYLP